MAVVYQNFTQPALGENVDVYLLGDPILGWDDTVTFFGYGDYAVTRVFEFDPMEPAPGGLPRYRLQLLSRISSSANVVPAGTPVVTYTEGVTVSEGPASSGVVALSFREADYRLIALNGNITFAAQHHVPARSITVRVINNNASHTLSFSSSWTFLGAKPTSIAANKTGVLSLTCLGYSDADIIAVWAVQA